MLKIKLSQTGTKNKKKYRLIAIEERDRRNGKAVEVLGYYNPIVKPPEMKVEMERVKYWISQGAQPTESVKKLLSL